MLKIRDIVSPRKEIKENTFQGVIQTHKIDAKEKRLENNPQEFLKITYPSSAIKRSIERIKEKLYRKSNQGGFLLVGPYGSGKSHCLITLYHLFNNPKLAKNWESKWGIKLEIPDNSKSVVISTRRYDVDRLWEPIFKLLGKGALLKEIKRFPTTDQIEKLAETGAVAIFIDEIENWYGSFDPEKQASLIEQNETFLEHLLEVAADPNKNLFVFITFLEEKEGLKKIFNRTKPVRIDVSPIEDREKVVLHRIFENVDDRDESKVSSIVEKYIEKYSDPIDIKNKYQYKRRMKRIYPFHPLLLDTLFQIYEAATERQDIRGMLGVIADAVRDTYNKKDLILLSYIDESAFRGIDLKLFEKYQFDLERTKDIGFAKEILKTILIFTLNEKTNGASESDILLSIFSPSEGHTLNSILMDLENMYGKAHYLHKGSGNIYLLSHEIEIPALLDKEKDRIKEHDIEKRIAEIVKKNVFENRVFILGYDEIPDHSKVKIVVSLSSWDGDEDKFNTQLNKFYKGKSWQNTYILVFPKVKTVFSFEIKEKVKRLIAGEKLLREMRGDEESLNKIIEDEKGSIIERIKTYYGSLIKWVERRGELKFRLLNVSPDINDIREKAQSDSSLCADFIYEEIKDKPNGIRIEDLINDFRKYRKYPFVLDEETVYSAIRNLHRDKRIVIQGERGKLYIEESPRTVEPGFVIVHPQYAPEIEEVPSEEGEGKGKEIEKEEGEEEIIPEKKERKELPLEGNSPRVILSQVEARTSEKDEFEQISVEYRFKDKISKQDMIRLIKQFPHKENAMIESKVVFWREKDET